MPIPITVAKLIERFEEQLSSYKSGDYKEASLRREFLDPFFKALGWDIDNEQGYAEAYKDVVHEDTLRIGGAVKAPDYGFRIGGVRKFFLEAKKPSVVVKDDISAAYQLRRYAWSAKLPLSILSDFEEFAVYDCRIRPNKDEKASKTRIFYCTFKEYAEKWDWIYSIFSREAILKGSFDRYAQTTKGKRGTEEVDNDFLSTIEKWRDNLAHNLAQRNQSLTQRELNFAVQRIIDRIIFLRICEDRGIEDYGRLLALTNGGDIYKRLGGLFYEADARYNSGLFHFKAERNTSEPPDEFTLSLKLDDKLLRDILKSLYYPDSPYEFSVLPADILGHVYEQFLGKVIRLTDGHRAVIEEKPEVRKAGGVYYTPTYIVDYIVKETVGKLTEGKTPKQMENLRFLDPACGSGSFLIGAYQYLLDCHFKWYMENDPDKFAKGKNSALVKTTSGWKLTVAERKRILLNNIYGVDIDSQAVEVTKLSLLLKVLEGETEQSIQTMITSFRERALPDLGSNIKCGNSLIGPDFYAQASLPAMSEEECLRINVFNWKEEFPEIFKAGGFDAVIGNPPYIPIEFMKEEEKVYYQNKHPQLERKYDSAPIFILEMMKNLGKNGLLSFISSVTWQTGENYQKLREYLFTKAGIGILINLPFDIFKNAYVDTGIYVLSSKQSSIYSIYRFPKKEKLSSLNEIPFAQVATSLIQQPEYKVILDPTAYKILNRVSGLKNFSPLGEFTTSTQGLAGNRFQCSKTIKGTDHFQFLQKGQAYRYLLEIEEIVFTDMSDKPSLQRFYEEGPKLLIRRVINRQDRLLVAFTLEKLVFKKDINPFLITEKTWNVLFVLGVLNSRLLSYIYVNTSSIATKDDFRQTTLAELRRLPIPKLGEQDKRHEQMVRLVNQMLKLQKQQSHTPQEKTAIDRQIAATDAQIDSLVYELYGLTEEEIRIVERK